MVVHWAAMGTRPGSPTAMIRRPRQLHCSTRGPSRSSSSPCEAVTVTGRRGRVQDPRGSPARHDGSRPGAPSAQDEADGACAQG